MGNNEILNSPPSGDVAQPGRLASIVPSLLRELPSISRPSTGELKGFPSFSVGTFGERAASEGAKIVGRLLAPSEQGSDSKKVVVDGAVSVLKILGLETKTADLLGTLMKRALDLSQEVKSIGCSRTDDGKPRMKIEFNSPITVGPLTLGEKGPLEFTMSPVVGKRGIEFAGIKGARVGIGPLKTDLTSASLSFDGGEPKLKLNNTITLPLSKLAKLVSK